jgi:hypothetical protein
MIIKIRPSDTSFLWGCKRCFWLKYKHGVINESFPAGGLTRNLATVQANQVRDQRIEKLIPSIGCCGEFHSEEKNVASEPIPVNSEHTFFTGGRYDALWEMDDDSVACIDLKSTTAARFDPAAQERKKTKLAETYGWQCNAYAFALKHPASESFAAEAKPEAPRGTFGNMLGGGSRKVSHIGLLFYQIDPLSEDTYKTIRDYAPVAINEKGFIAWVQEAADIIALDEAPEPRMGIGSGGNLIKSGSCEDCLYLERFSMKFGVTEQLPDHGIPPVFGELLG